jgi:hypothetical protein
MLWIPDVTREISDLLPSWTLFMATQGMFYNIKILTLLCLDFKIFYFLEVCTNM